MQKQLRFPLRFKILIILLLLVISVLSLITITMARLFHTDKTAYIHDLTSIISLHTAEEVKSMMSGYKERMLVFSRLIYDQDLTEEQKSELIKRLFEDFQDFVAVTVYREGVEQATIYDAQTFGSSDLTKDAYDRYRQKNPLPIESIQTGEVYIKNSRISSSIPTITMAIAQTAPEGKRPEALAALIRIDDLMRLSKRSGVFETFIIDAQDIFLSHTNPEMISQPIPQEWAKSLTGLRQGKSIGTTIQYRLKETETIGGFSYLGFGGLTAGVQIPKAAAYLTARELLNNLIWIALTLLIASAVIGLFGSRVITKPIEKLSDATRVIAKGQFNISVDVKSRDEIGMFATSFNQMTSELNVREKALKEAQTALIHSEKMAAFGQLGAGIAHEVKNPLAGILGYAQLTLRKLEKGTPLYENVEVIEKETKRCKTIIDNLLKFARQEKVAFHPIDVNRVMEDAVTIVNHQLAIHKIKIEKTLAPDIPTVMGDANQLQQVIMNLMINAQQAMAEKPGAVTVATRLLNPESIEIRVSDTGPGIPKEIQTRIFEPFFTTKPAGEGTGLGLSVSYGIIKEHKGEIRIESEVGRGSTFIITLPAARNESKTGSEG